MRHLFLALPFLVLPAITLADDHHHHEHASLAPHQHGAAQLDVALDEADLELVFHSPAANLLGFEHAPGNDAQRAKASAARARLEQPHTLFGLPDAAACRVSDLAIESPLLNDSPSEHQDHGADKQHHQNEENGHSDIHARYRFVCAHPDALKTLDLLTLFKTFPGTETVQIQLIGPNGQKSMQLQPERSTINF